MTGQPLDFDWESVQGQRVVSIQGTKLQLDPVARSQCDELVLHLEQSIVHVSVNKDTDEVIVRDLTALDDSMQ